MDGNDRQRSQYGQPYPQIVSTRPPLGQSMGPPATDRYSQPGTPARSEPTGHSLTRSYPPSYPYGYQEQPYGGPSMQSSSPMQGVEMQYSPAYVQDVSRQQATGQPSQQQYGQYGSSNVLPSVAQHPMYDSINPYQHRQSAAIDVMSSQMGYIQQGDPSNLQLQQTATQYGSSQAEQTHYSVTSTDRSTLHPQYGTDFAVMETRSTQSPSQPSAAEQESLQQGFREFEQQMRATFEAIAHGKVTEASEKILPLSRWLTSSVVALGLHHDDEDKYSDRLTLWQHFNLCWEALGQKQKDITEEAFRTGRQPSDVLGAESMHRMVDELLSMCDRLETYGLVDYEMGIAEEQITHIFTQCLDLLQRQSPGHNDRPVGISRTTAA